MERVEQPALPSGMFLCRSPGFPAHLCESVATQSPSSGHPEWMCHSPFEHTLSVASSHSGLGLNSPLSATPVSPECSICICGAVTAVSRR